MENVELSNCIYEHIKDTFYYGLFGDFRLHRQVNRLLQKGGFLPNPSTKKIFDFLFFVESDDEHPYITYRAQDLSQDF